MLHDHGGGRGIVKESKYRFPATECEIMQFDSKGTRNGILLPP